jgi:hypothetical protein
VIQNIMECFECGVSNFVRTVRTHTYLINDIVQLKDNVHFKLRYISGVSEGFGAPSSQI